MNEPPPAPLSVRQIDVDVCRVTVGDEAYLFGEQWVLKGADRGMKFSWHQDAGYVKYRIPGTKLRSYLTCWCALDDVDEGNGTVYVLPHSKGGTREMATQVHQGGLVVMVGRSQILRAGKLANELHGIMY